MTSIEDEYLDLPNETKIRFCNAFHNLNFHAYGVYCHACATYLANGEGDLCKRGKHLIASELIAHQES